MEVKYFIAYIDTTCIFNNNINKSVLKCIIRPADSLNSRLKCSPCLDIRVYYNEFYSTLNIVSK